MAILKNLFTKGTHPRKLECKILVEEIHAVRKAENFGKRQNS